MKRLHIILLALVVSVVSASAQSEILFSEGLAIANCHQYGRQATFTDQFAWRYFAPGYQSPKAGAALFTDDKGEPVIWKEIQADSTGRFTGRAAANGYIYRTYRSDRERGGIINITGNAMFYWNGEPHPGDPYDHKYMNVPVKIRKGLNEMYIRTSGFMRQGVTARLTLPGSSVIIGTDDPTLPHVVPGKDNSALLGGVVVLNTSGKPLQNLQIRSRLQGREITEPVPEILPYSTRKIAFRFNGSGITGKGSTDCELMLLSKDQVITRSVIPIESVAGGEPYSETFISQIDGSVQYYAVNPQSGTGSASPALFLSVHGAGVEAIGQARAYQPKDWGTLVAPTNRRPRGFNWEDWGRIDALEVLDIAISKFRPDPSRIYLTGHSMGGHGTWYLGATYPGKWAAIAPCAGYPSLMAYASADGKIPQPGDNKAEQDLYRASNGSNVPALARNLGAAGVYVHHGDDDRTVSVDYARQMREILGSFHPDFAYYEYPGGSHWWSNESVDWPPLFDFFRSHTIKPDSQVNQVDFMTANPAVSSSCRWVSVLQQSEPLKYSTIQIKRDADKGAFTGKTVNIAALKLDLTGIRTDTVVIRLDGDEVRMVRPRTSTVVHLQKAGSWAPGRDIGPTEKGTVRNGTFKEPFNHRMVFVYGTTGTKAENDWSLAKAKYDAETWYYRGNGAIDMVSDAQFDPSDYPNRGVILYGNATTNSAWAKVLSSCPIQVRRGSITIGDKTMEGDGYGAYIAYPRADSPIASVAAIAGTGLPGMHAADANQYFSGGSGFPDYLIFTSDMPREGAKAIIQSGFFTNSWQLENSGR
jgi:dienelactone hydrolase